MVAPGAGRTYPMGPVHAVFKADGAETRGQYSISEWWLEPYTRGPGAHHHDEDDVFFVIEGTLSFFVGGAWFDAPKGSLVIAPESMPDTLEVTAKTWEDEIMGVRSRAPGAPLEGVQFHPESIMTTAGKTLLANFLAMAREANQPR